LTLSKTDKYVGEQFRLWDQRSKTNWELDISFIEPTENQEYIVMPNGVKLKIIRKLH
jgi:hypothetical protein